MWRCIESGKKSAFDNMDLDGALLEKLDPEGDPILHLYDWQEPSATYGYFTKPSDWLNLEGVDKVGLSLARRPTGGGIIFHVTDLAFSVLVPSSHKGFSENTLENYHYINKKVLQAVQELIKETKIKLLPEEEAAKDPSCSYFCMAKPTIYDVMLGNKKIAGAAQRKRKQGYLHQGSIALSLPSQSFLEAVLKPGTKVFEAMQAYTYPLLGREESEKGLEEMRDLMKKFLKKIFLED